MPWRFRSRLKSSQALRLRELMTRVAAFWPHRVRWLSARSCSTTPPTSGHLSDRSTSYHALGPIASSWPEPASMSYSYRSAVCWSPSALYRATVNGEWTYQHLMH